MPGDARPARGWRRTAAAWLPFLAATALFNALRGLIYVLVERDARPVLVDYAVEADAALLGVPSACAWVQAALRAPALDVAMVAVHASHFAYFLAVGALVWRVRPDAFWQYRRVLLAVMAGGLAGYAAAPTAPPWMAAELGALPPVAHVKAGVYSAVPALFAAFDTNPVAAMPSLHAAFPVACAVLVWRLVSRRAGALAWAYVALVSFASIYLGEHYVVDLVAGGALAVASLALPHVPPRPAPGDRLGVSLAVSAVLVGAAIVVAALS